MPVRCLFWAALLVVPLSAQSPCPATLTYDRCELVFELNEQETRAHPNPYLTVELRAEFKSPRHRTLALPGFWDGGKRLVIRFAPTEPGEWEYRITSNLPRFHSSEGKLQASASEQKGFLRAANLHHWRYADSDRAHLWMADAANDLFSLPEARFQQRLKARAAQKFTHVRAVALGSDAGEAQAQSDPDRPDPEYFRLLDQRIAQAVSSGLIVDVVLGRDGPQLRRLFPQPKQRERFVRYMSARYAAFPITWLLLLEFENAPPGLTQELGEWLRQADPYGHPRSAGSLVTSSPLLPEKWMTHIWQGSPDAGLGAIEHQLHAVPFVNSGARGAAEPAPAEFRRQLWSSSMNGSYPAPAIEADDSAATRLMTIWYEFFAATRHWELEPYFDLDGGTALALPGVEYIVYLERAAPVEVRMERHGYDVRWFNPATGEYTVAKEYKGERFAAEPPDPSHDWVLHLSREGRKASMLRSYKFESRPPAMQEIETDPKKTPFEIAAPEGDRLAARQPPKFAAKLRRETRGTRAMQYLWTGEAVGGGTGLRVLGTGAQGTLEFPRSLAPALPALINLRVTGMNANGKVYVADRIYNLQP